MEYQQLDIPDQFPNNTNNHISTTISKMLVSSSHTNINPKIIENFPSSQKNTKRNNNTHNKYFKQNSNDANSSTTKENNKDTSNKKSHKHNTNIPTPKHKKHNQDTNARNLFNFLESQKNFAQEKQKKLSMLKEQKQRSQALECKNTPAINNHSRRLTDHFDTSCYQRLSRDRTLQQTRTRVATVIEDQFHPKILSKSKCLRRKQNVADMLYNDAQRRIEKQKITQREKLLKSNIAPTINKNTNKFIIKTLRKQFSQCIKSLKNSQKQQIYNLTQQIALDILGKIFKIDLISPEKEEVIVQDVQISNKLIECIFNDHKSTVNPEKLWTFIQVILGCKQTVQIFTFAQQKKICNEFTHTLYRNRMTKTKQNKQGVIHTFKPEILKNSERLAQKKREKMAIQAEHALQKQRVRLNMNDSYEIPIADLYILERMHHQEYNKIRKETEEQKQFEECTFKPKLNKWDGMKNAQIMPSSTKSSRARESFNKRVQIYQQNTLITVNNTLGDSMDLNSSLTFDRRRSTSKSSLNRSFKQVRNMESAILRMQAGRKEKQYINQCQRRGYPNDIQNWQKFRKSEKKAVLNAHKQLKGYQSKDCSYEKQNLSVTKNKSKEFIFDIHIKGGTIETIHLNTNQDVLRKVQQLTLKYDLDQEKKLKLMRMIRTHLSLYLEEQRAMKN